MKIRLVLLASTFHPIIGGGESYALNLARGLGALGHEVTVVTDMVRLEPSVALIGNNVEVRRLHAYRENLQAPDRIFWEQMQFGLYEELSQILDERRPNIVMSNSLDMCPVARVASIHAKCPWIATFHEQSPERDPLGEASLVFAYATLAPDAILAGSRFYMDRALRFRDPSACHLIYHGIDTEQFRDVLSGNEVRSRYGIAENRQLIVSAGRLKERKGFSYLLRALHRLRRRGFQVSLVVAGTLNSADVRYRDQLRELVRSLGLTDAVCFDEDLTHEEMPWLFSGGDLVVQPSLEEGLGLAVIEAMACERAVVTTRIPGIAEIVTDSRIATLVEPASEHQLADAIGSLLNNTSARREIGVAARRHVLSKFSIDRMVSETTKLIIGLVQGKCATDPLRGFRSTQ